MEIRLLREFLVLSDCLNFSRAAERLNMTQPVLSRHIKYLEDHFGAQLLSRNTHKVELTDVGRLLAAEAAKIVEQYEQLLAVIRSSPGVSRQSLSIGLLGEATRSFLSGFLTSYREAHPQVTIESFDSDLETITAYLDQGGGCDLAFLIRPRGLEIPPHLESIPIVTDPLCVGVNGHHPLAAKESVSLQEIIKWPIIGLSRQKAPLAYEFNNSFFLRHGLDHKLWKECPNLETCCFNIEFNDRAVTLIPMHRRYLIGPNSKMLTIEEIDCVFDINVMWNRNRINPCLSVFLREFREFVNSKERQHDLSDQNRSDPVFSTR